MRFTAWIPTFGQTREDASIPFEADSPRDAARISLETFADCDTVWPAELGVIVERDDDGGDRRRYSVSVPVSMRVTFAIEDSTVKPIPLKRMIGLAGIDGIRPVFWGIGESIAAARCDAREHLDDLSNLTPDDLTVVEVSEDRARSIVAGDVALRGAELVDYAASRNL